MQLDAVTIPDSVVGCYFQLALAIKMTNRLYSCVTGNFMFDCIRMCTFGKDRDREYELLVSSTLNTCPQSFWRWRRNINGLSDHDCPNRRSEPEKSYLLSTYGSRQDKSFTPSRHAKSLLSKLQVHVVLLSRYSVSWNIQIFSPSWLITYESKVHSFSTRVSAPAVISKLRSRISCRRSSKLDQAPLLTEQLLFRTPCQKHNLIRQILVYLASSHIYIYSIQAEQ